MKLSDALREQFKKVPVPGSHMPIQAISDSMPMTQEEMYQEALNNPAPKLTAEQIRINVNSYLKGRNK